MGLSNNHESDNQAHHKQAKGRLLVIYFVLIILGLLWGLPLIVAATVHFIFGTDLFVAFFICALIFSFLLSTLEIIGGGFGFIKRIRRRWRKETEKNI